MGQIRCKSAFLSLIFLAPQFLISSELSIKCSILDQESKIPLSLSLKKAEALRSPDEDESEEARVHKLESIVSVDAGLPIQMKGIQEKMTVLDWERLDYYPMDLLDVREGNLEHATFYYAKEHEDAGDYDLILVGLERLNADGTTSYAGSYGSYKGNNLLCPLP